MSFMGLFVDSGQSEADWRKLTGIQRLFSPFSQGNICESQALPKFVGADGLSPCGGSNGTLAYKGNAALGGFSQARPTP